MSRSHPLMPFISVTLGIALFSLMDALMKGASMAVGAYSAMLVRSVFGVAIMWPLWRWRGGTMPDREALKLHALRGAISAGMATTFFWGLVRMPLAEGIAISFIAPLIALYLSAAMLGEKVTGRAVLGSLLGLCGVGVIAAGQIGAREMGPDAAAGIAAVLLSAVLYAFNLIYQRKQAQLASPSEVALFQMAFSGLFLAVLAPLLLVLPGAETALGIAGSAALAAVSLMLLSWGYGRAEAQALLPIEYSAFIWAALFGWLIFDEAVTAATLGGVVFIVFGCWIAARQRPGEHNEQTAL
ncbi:DMT family transporter [Novosphingobium sp. TH158]|uniref:DMT family transporter n=1 Tax=Novosphingobium sp. TH158 TaxID=2067455 RepID=UPI000C7C8CE0|nr:DMT family transporter [Novosphingobium sp. TH158]PLK27311.1 EamA family transporter [Novosphingobium sp. TH158]